MIFWKNGLIRGGKYGIGYRSIESILSIVNAILPKSSGGNELAFRFHFGKVFQRPGHRSGNGQYPRICQGEGDRAERTLRCRRPHERQRGKEGSRRGRGSQEDARTDAG